jgi:hypothetical protein
MKNKSVLSASIISLCLFLSGCSVEQLNTINKITENIKNMKELTINIKNIDSGDIQEISLNDKTLSKSDYNYQENTLKLENLEEGKHVIKFKHKKYGEVNIPVEVRGDNKNNFQFTPNIIDNSIKDWVLGADNNSDGTIDTDSFVSREVDDYVVVREFSGSTNYIPKQDFQKNFREQKPFPKPKELREDDFRLDYNNYGGVKPFAPKEISNPMVQPNQPKLNSDFNEKIHLPLPEKYNKYKIAQVLINDRPVPKDAFKREQNDLVVKNNFLSTDKVNFKVHLLDETGGGILLSINSKKPFLMSENNNKIRLKRYLSGSC